VGLVGKGHEVVVYTSHHDPSHSFKETHDGTLTVKVFGDFLPRSIAGRGHILCATLRGVYLSFAMLLVEPAWDVFIVDQLSVMRMDTLKSMHTHACLRLWLRASAESSRAFLWFECAGVANHDADIPGDQTHASISPSGTHPDPEARRWPHHFLLPLSRPEVSSQRRPIKSIVSNAL
jgi:hypothetical protein